MNINENAPVLNRGRGTGRQLKVVPIQRPVMGPPTRPVPKHKESSRSANTNSSLSNLIWRPNQRSSANNSTTARTPSSSRSRSSSEPESRVVIALSEGRGEAAGEVGIAAINIARPSLILCQISDTQSYINTLTKINILNPSEILIPLTFIESFVSNRLMEKVKEQFPDIKITGVSRVSFNKTTGLNYVKQLCVPSMNSIFLILEHRYYALTAASALLTYTESVLYVTYAKQSIKIEYQESEGSTIIDVSTADRLELVASARPTMKKRFSCLLDVLNHCVTKIGSRTLRASILQPPCLVPDIEARLDCVTELVEHPEMQKAIEVVLSNLSNIDQLLTLATVLPNQVQNCSERQLNYILLLNKLLDQITPLQDIFENSTQPFFMELVATLNNPAFKDMKNLVREMINPEAHPSKGENGIFQRCFAIKSGINSLLDLIRKSYSERIEDMRNYVTSFGEEHSLAFALHNNNKKGYHIILSLNAYQKKTLKKDDLPPECIGVERLASSYSMKTQYLIDLSDRVENILAEILKMSNIMIHKLLVQIRSNMGIFYKLCEDIAKLDMLQSLAKASSVLYYVRPEFAEYLEVIEARHPMLDFLCSKEPSANSMHASKEYNINIITGPNGSGKSIFVRQVILIQVMAQVGCYVPAQSATLRASDRILARVYLEDNMDCGASAFVLEMKEMQYFHAVLTPNTLIIIDELCRSTSVEEGTALAMGMCEKLMKTSAFVYFTTHFKFLCKLQDLHCNVKTWQLETLTEIIDNQIVLRFTYNVISGVTALEHYGIFLAKGSWPEIIIKYAEDILKKISSADKRPQPHVEPVNAAARLKYDLEADLQSLKAKKQLTRAKINEKLQKYQHDLESLGYQGHHMLASDRINENYDNHYDTVSVTGESSINFLNESAQIRDYFNLQSQQSQSDDMSDISQGINHTMLNPMMDHSSTNMQNKNVFENLLYGHKNTPQFFNFGNANQEMENNSVFPEEFRFPSNQNNSRLDLSNDGTIISGYEYPENTFNFSHSNIFEPEVILQSHENLPFPSAFHLLNSSTISAENTAFIKHDNFCMTVHQKYSYTANENSFRPNFDGSMVYKDNLTFSNNNSSVYGDRENNNKLRNNYFLQHNDESFLSVNEQQFSVPLQQHTERTSTPEIPVLQGQSMWYHQSNMNLPNLQAPKSRNIEDCNLKQIQLNYTSPDEGRFNKTPITNKKEQEATMSDIIQWGPGLFPSPAVFRTPISNSNHCVSNVSQAFPKIDSLYEDNDDTKELEPKSDSIKWGPRLYLPPTQFKTPEINNASKLNKSQASSKTNSLYGDIGSQIDLKKPEPKSDSTKSNSTKWGPGLFASPAVFRTPKSINQSVSNGSNLNISQAFPKTDSLYEDNDDKKELEPKSDSSKRGPRLYPSPFLFRTPEINNNASKLNKSQTSSKTNSLYGDIGSQIDLKKQEPKSDSTKSDSTKWGPGLFASPAVFRTPKSINQSVSNGSNLNISQASPKTDSLYEDNRMRRSIKTPISDKKKQEPKSDSSKSDSIKWGLGLCPSPTVFRTPKSINQSVLNGSNLNTSQASTITTDSLYGDIGTGQINCKDSDSNNNLLQKPVNINSKQQFSSRGSVTPKNMTCKSQAGVNKSNNFVECTSKQIKSISSSSHSHDEDWRRITTPIGSKKGQDSKSDSTKSDSIKWTAPLLPSPNLSSKSNTTGTTPNRTNKSDVVGGTNKHNNTSILCNPNNYYSQANITEIINDLESCSEYFSDSHDWDFVDEGVKSKPVQLSDNERSKTVNQKVGPSKPAPTNENHQQLEEKLENDAELQSHENIYSGQSSEMEYHTPLKISTIAEIHEPPSRQRKSNIEKVSQIKSKIPKNGDAPQTNFHNEMDQIQYATEYQPQYYKNALSKIQEHELISSGNNKTMANTRTENYSNLNKNQSSNVGKKDSVKNLNEINSQQCQKGDVGLKSISLHDISLEPLGDIHLELFSDESQIDAKEENVVLNESSGCYINATATNDQCKVQVDCTVSKNVHLSTDEYDTAQSMIVSSQQDTIHFNTPTSFFDPEFTSTPLDKSPQIGKKISPKLKRRKLGLTTRKVDKVKTEIPTKPIFNRKTSPEVAGSSQLDVEMSHTPSDFESSVSKKSLLLQKVRQQNSAKKPKISKTKPMKFKPPKQLTKKQVEEEFYEQDKKLMESGDESQYLEHIMNRPSFKQLQEIKQIASFHRTSSGVVVVPAKDKKPKTRKRKFVPPLLKKTSVPFDLTIFADKNSSKYEEFMNNNNTKNAIHVRVDVAPFQAIESQVVSKTDINEHTAAKNKINILQNITLVPPDQQTESTPKEYYSTPSTNRIDNIVEKYLKPQVEVSSESKIFERFNSSVFSKSTLVLDLDDSL